jgi:hypothetical protein
MPLTRGGKQDIDRPAPSIRQRGPRPGLGPLVRRVDSD